MSDFSIPKASKKGVTSTYPAGQGSAPTIPLGPPSEAAKVTSVPGWPYPKSTLPATQAGPTAKSVTPPAVATAAPAPLLERITKPSKPVTVAPILLPVQSIKIPLIPYTVYVLCGPTRCGKSTFAKELNTISEVMGLSSLIISSDEERKFFSEISRPLNKQNIGTSVHAPGYSTLSKAAFGVLHAKLSAAMEFPVNVETIIVDTTGFDDKFRNDVIDEAGRNDYRVVLVSFEYKTRKEYFPPEEEFKLLSENSRNIITNSIDRFRKQILPRLGGSTRFDSRIRVTSKQATNKLVCSYANVSQYVHDLVDTYDSFYLPSVWAARAASSNREGNASADSVYVVIGDSHECVPELKELISHAKAKYPNAKFIHVGDFLDKGLNTEEMINFMYERFEQGDILLQANHEKYVLDALKGSITRAPAEVEAENFQSLAVLQNRPDLLKKVGEIWGASIPFAIIEATPESLPVYITHAPCAYKYLGKISNYGMKSQRNYRVKDRSVPVEKEFKWLFDTADSRLPMTIFGHVSHMTEHPKDLVFKNRVFLDTGCVYGGHLSAVVIINGKLADTLQVKSTGDRTGKGPTVVTELVKKALILGRDERIDNSWFDLTVRDMRLLKSIKENGTRYISGTMAPGPSSETEIEPFEGAVKFLVDNYGVDQVGIEPKHMGSRCQLYLFRDDASKTFATSRGGWKIQKINGKTEEELQAFLTSEWEKYKPLMEDLGDLILDGELLPWSALGKGLIDETFKPYCYGVASTLTRLIADISLENLPDFNKGLNLLERSSHYDEFTKTLERYSRDEEISFAPFNVLWSAQESTTINWKSPRAFLYLTTLARLGKMPGQLTAEDITVEDMEDAAFFGGYVMDLNDEHSIEVGKKYFMELTANDRMEGVVLKPISHMGKNPPPPYIKVRSPEYLRLVYGYDYPMKLSRLCADKKIHAKVRTSLKEYELAEKMLVASPEEKEKYAIALIGEIRSEQGLDPRL